MSVCYKCYISIELKFLDELMLIKQVHQKNVTFVTIDIFFYFLLLILMVSINPSDIAVLKIKGFDHHCIISLISKNEVQNLMQNADFTEKSGTL